ncbi:MAG TPA: peptidylprolyl isomerase [Coleofasciculaceae cyanobacterium]|jgi:parvulin-like peptidyl-prolyl isomerase
MNGTKTTLLAGLTAFTVLLAGCAGNNAGMGIGGEKVATVNGTAITKADYDKTYDEMRQALGLDKMPQQQREMLADTVQQMALNKLIYHALVYGAAEKAGVKVSEQEIQQYKQDKIFKNPALKEQFQAFLSQNKMSEADFDKMVREQLLLNKFTEAKGGKDVQVSDAEVKSFYDKNKDQFKVPERIHASHILLKAIVPQMKQALREKNPKITDAELETQINAKKAELKAKADKLFAEIKATPAKFEDLAKKNSEDPISAKNGGDLGPMVENNIDPVFWEAIQKTQDGKMYPGVLVTQFGYHIIKVGTHMPPKQEGFAEAKEFIKDQLGQQRKQEFLKRWAEESKNTAKIDIEPKYMPKAAQAGAAGPEGMAPGGQAPAAMQAQPAPQQQAKH